MRLPAVPSVIQRFVRWLGPELLVGLALMCWAGAKVTAGLGAVFAPELDTERPHPLFAMAVFAVLAWARMLFAGGRPNQHVGRAAALLWTHVLGLGVLAFGSSSAYLFSNAIQHQRPTWAWPTAAVLGALSTLPLTILLAQRRSERQREHLVLAVGLLLLASYAGYCVYPSSAPIETSIMEASLVFEYQGLGLLLAFHLALASVVLLMEARQLVVARAVAILCVGQLVVVLIGELAGMSRVGATAAQWLVRAANLVDGLSVVAGLAVFASAALTRWFSDKRMPTATVVLLVAIVPLFAFSQGPNAPERSLDRMVFNKDNVPDEVLVWPIDDDSSLLSWVDDARQAPSSTYVGGQGEMFTAEPLVPLDIRWLEHGSAWVSANTRIEALRPLADHDHCGYFVDAYWLSSHLSGIDRDALRRLPALAVQALRPARRRIYFDRTCDWAETYEVDAEVAPPMGLLLQRQQELTLVVHGTVPVAHDPPSTEIRRPQPNPLALRESPWSIALGLVLGLAIGFVRMMGTRPALGEPAPASAAVDRRWPPWLMSDQVTERHYEAAPDGSPYREQGLVIGTSSVRSSKRLFLRRLYEGLAALVELAFWTGVVAGLSFALSG